MLAGLPSWRIKGFYLVVCTLAVQFFVEWVFTAFRWFSNGNSSGQVSVPSLRIAGHDFSSPVGHYWLALGVVAALTWVARNIVESELGRRFLAVRDMDTAAAVIGIPVLRTKLLAFAISSFYCGVAGALWGFVYLGSFDPRAWELGRSFQVLFIIIIGGMGSIAGSFVGAAFMLLLPILMSHLASGLARRRRRSGDAVELPEDCLRDPDHLLPDQGAAGAGQHLARAPAARASLAAAAVVRSSIMNILRLEDVEAVYGQAVLALRGISLAVPAGSVVALLGANGAGKTTTLKAISRLLGAELGEVTRGRIVYDGRDVTRADPADLVRAGVVQVLEGRRCFPHLTVEENLLMGAESRRLSRHGAGEPSSRRSTRCSRACATAGGAWLDTPRAASSRWWPSGARCSRGPSWCCSTSRRWAWRP